MRNLFGFPNPVNEKAARTVATVVALTGITILVTGWLWLLIPLAYGFVARTLTGPRLSPLGWLAMNVVAPRLGAPKYSPGPPKRFAQAIGATFTTSAAILGLGFGWDTAALVLTGILTVFATLEAALGFCAGCFVFGYLMKWGLIPEDTCEACANIALRRPAADTSSPDASVPAQPTVR